MPPSLPQQGSGSPGGALVGGLSLAPLVGWGVALADPPLPLPATENEFNISSSSWLLLNLNVSGYFRVNYNPENWDQLLRQLSANHQVHGASWGVGCGWAPTPCTHTPHAPTHPMHSAHPTHPTQGCLRC